MKTIRENSDAIILSVLEFAVGILLLINPIRFTTAIMTMFGVIFIISGFFSIIRYFRADAKEAAAGQNMFKGLVCLLIGVFCTVKSGWFIATFPVLAIVYAVVILLTGLQKIQWTTDMIRLKKSRWLLTAVSAILSILCAVVIILNPFKSATALWMFTGISLMIEAIYDVIILITAAFSKAKNNE